MHRQLCNMHQNINGENMQNDKLGLMQSIFLCFDANSQIYEVAVCLVMNFIGATGGNFRIFNGGPRPHGPLGTAPATLCYTVH